MPTHRPIGVPRLIGVTKEQQEKEITVVKSLEVFVPRALASELVEKMLAEIDADLRNQPLPVEPRWLWETLALFGVKTVGDLPFLDKRRQELADQELAYAISGVVRHWLSTLNLAHRNISRETPDQWVYLEEYLLPRDGAPRRHAWESDDDCYKTWLDLVIRPLSANTALTHEGAIQLLRAFIANLKQKVDEVVVTDPNGFVVAWCPAYEFRIAKDDGGYYVNIMVPDAPAQ